MIILGIDPGTTRIGYSVIKDKNNKLSHLESGLITPKVKSLASRLMKIDKSILRIIEKHNPDIIGLEKIYFSKNHKTAIKVAHSRGVLMLNASKNNINCLELSPTEIKSAVTGNGQASKKAVAKMVGHFLNIRTEDIIDDTTDAMAIAIATSTLKNNKLHYS